MQNFSYHAPATLAEAAALMKEDPEHSRYLAGGTDLYLALEHGNSGVGRIIDLKHIPGLDGIERGKDGSWRIGALTRMADLEHHAELRKACPALTAAAAVVGGPPLRNRATVGGNLVNASPAADTATPLTALDATLEVDGGKKPREIPLAGLCTGPRKTTLAPGEVLAAVRLPPPGKNAGNAFARLTRSAMDIAVVNAAAALTLDKDKQLASLRVALGSVGPTIIQVPGLDALHGKPVNDALLAEVRLLSEAAAKPIDDVRAGADYRREMAGVLAARAVREAFRHAGGRAS